MSESVDFLIVGGGISGRMIQLELTKRNASTLVIDDSQNNHCTVVAAGLANPLVGKFFTIAWRTNDFFKDLAPFYTDLENRLGASFFRPLVMKRIIASAGEQNIWLSKALQSKYNGYCSFANDNIAGLNTNYGILNVYKGGVLNTPTFLEACHKNLPTRQEVFYYDELHLDQKTYKDIHYKNILFCEGHKITANPWFYDICGIIATKGELLEIETDLSPENPIYLGGVFIQHLKNKTWRVGSTYAHHDDSLHPTQEKKQELQTKLNKVLKLPYEILRHYCGVRPATEDRNPVMGVHPMHNNMYIFNGMGSKAVSLTPILAAEMTDFILNGAPLHPNLNITRFC